MFYLLLKQTETRAETATPFYIRLNLDDMIKSIGSKLYICKTANYMKNIYNHIIC